MNLEQLRTLVAVVDHGGLSAAARALRISQPAVTKQLQRLEAELGARLLDRGERRVLGLTPAGERVLAFARRTLQNLQNLERELVLLQQPEAGSLAVGASTIPGEYLLPGLLAAFRNAYPQIEIGLTIADTAEIVRKIMADEVDVGVVGSDMGQPGLRLEPLLRDDVVLVVPPDHPLAREESTPVERLWGEPLILREAGSGTRHTVEAAFQAAGSPLRREDVRLVLGSTQAVLQAVEQGLGIGFVSARAAARAEAEGHLRCVRVSGVDLGRDLYLGYRTARAATPAIIRFLEFARTFFAR